MYTLQCEVLTNEVDQQVPGHLTETASNNKTVKRMVSVSAEESMSKKKTSQTDQDEMKNKLKKITNQGSDPSSNSVISNSADVTAAQSPTNDQLTNLSQTLPTSDDIVDVSCEKMLELGNNNEFPKKIVIIDEKECRYTSILNFFSFIDTFKDKGNHDVLFKCKICKKTYTEKLGKTTNLNKHLKTHDSLKNLLKQYEIYQDGFKEASIDDNTLLLIKYFISSNTALAALKNKWLRELLTDKVKLPGQKTFRNSILPRVYSMLREEIEKRLQTAEAICLITDTWTNKQNDDFIALCAVITNESFERQIVVIDMLPMEAMSHNAENIKSKIEAMVRYLTNFLFKLFDLMTN